MSAFLGPPRNLSKRMQYSGVAVWKDAPTVSSLESIRAMISLGTVVLKGSLHHCPSALLGAPSFPPLVLSLLRRREQKPLVDRLNLLAILQHTKPTVSFH